MINPFHSQFDEDRFLVENHFVDVNEKGFFLDIGAGDPVKLSNTYYFEQKGWEGICIDGDPRNFMALLEKRKKVVFGVLNSFDGLTDFNISDHGADLSSMEYANEAKKSVQACFSLTTLFLTFPIPEIDLLSLDVEGREIPILEELLKFRKPTIIITEYDSVVNDVEAFFKDKDYKLLLKNQANLIYQKI